MLLYGNAERAIIEVTHRIAKGEDPKTMFDIRGLALIRTDAVDDHTEIDMSSIDDPARAIAARMRSW